MKIVALVALACAATTLSAARAEAPVVVSAMTGQCERLSMAGEAVSQACVPRVYNTVNSERQTNGFSFEYDSGRIMKFEGPFDAEVHPDADTAVQRVESVVFSQPLQRLKAVGACRYTNPTKGTPSLVSCWADTDDGVFVGRFKSDGRPPRRIGG